MEGVANLSAANTSTTVHDRSVVHQSESFPEILSGLAADAHHQVSVRDSHTYTLTCLQKEFPQMIMMFSH